MHHMAQTNTVTVLEHCPVTPPRGTVAEKSLPLTFFDLPWLHLPLIHHICFHEYPHSKTHFVETTIPKLKDSLSLTLKHYFPLAGNLIFPPNSCKPEIRYVDGDSVSLTFAESSGDFNHLTANHARNADEFYPLVPKLQPVSLLLDTLQAPVLAVQVTLFPNSGVCVGLTIRHVAADGNASTSFIRSFASITKFGGDEALLASGSLPFYDRTAIKDPNGLDLDNIFWSQVGERKFEGSQPEYVPTNKVRATFVMGQADVQRLKKTAMAQRPTLSHVSSFTITCAYVWACIVRSRAASGNKVGEDELEHFVFGADCRALLDPPLPANYFGNCLVGCIATVKTVQLMEEHGFLIAVEAIRETIREKLHNNEGVLKGAERWILDFEALNLKKIVGVAGSPKFAIYDMDFGWGKPKKHEVVSIDTTGSISLNECRDSKGDIEVGLSFPKTQMDAFAAIFAHGLKLP